MRIETINEKKPHGNKGKRRTPEQLERMRKSHLGKRHTKESKKKISLSKIGKKRKPFSAEWREKLANSNRGRKFPLSFRLAISQRTRGNKNPMWKGGIYPENRAARDRMEYKIWREAVFARDNWTCQACFDRTTTGHRVELHAHHLKPFSAFPELRTAIDNGITLCVSCHRKTETWGRRI